MTIRILPTQALSDPGVASAEDGFVVLDGPDGIAVTLTPEAAAETGKRLVKAAEDARNQVYK